MAKKHFLITAGGTREYIDPVRFISNASSGRMGYSLAAAAVKSGHKVTVITAPTFLIPPEGVKVVNIETSGEMFKAVKENFSKCDCLIMAAAVSDYKPFGQSKTKIKKADSDLTIKLKPTVDILKWAAGHKKANQFVAGFALEDKNLRKNAEAKLKDKNLDMIVANNPAAISADSSLVQIKLPGEKWIKFSKASKLTIAKKIIKLIDSFC